MNTLRWPMGESELRAIIRELQFRYFKWDVYVDGRSRLLPETIVLTPAEHEHLVSLAEQIAAALQQIEQRVRTDNKLLKSLQIPDAVIGLMQAETSSPLQLARYDFFPAPDGTWSVSEFNEDVPGGFNEAIAAAALLSESHAGYDFNDVFAESFLEALPTDGTIALMYATGYSEDLQHMLILQSLIERRGQPTILCAPNHLRVHRGNPHIARDRISAVVRFYPGEWFALVKNLRHWKRAVSDLPMLNPISRLIRQSKLLFALWGDRNVSESSERQLLERVAPHTLRFDPAQSAMLRQAQHDWVIKHAYGRMGDTVVMGSLASPLQWNEAIKEAEKKSAHYLIQKRFDVRPLKFSRGELYPAIGVYLINGRFAGYYSRVAEKPFITHQAYYVPTVVCAA